MIDKNMRALSKAELIELLPRVGDTRLEIPTIVEGRQYSRLPRRCTVVEVNRAHLWYRVKFENGFHETYKMPFKEVDAQ